MFCAGSRGWILGREIQLANRLAESLSRKEIGSLGIKELQAY